MAHLLLWLLLTWIVWPVNHGIVVLETTAQALLEIAEAISNLLRDNVFVRDGQTLSFTHSARWTMGVLLGFTWKSAMPWRSLSETTAHPQLEKEQNKLLSRTLITDSGTAWLLVEIQGNNAKLASAHWHLSWKMKKVWKLFHCIWDPGFILRLHSHWHTFPPH